MPIRSSLNFTIFSLDANKAKRPQLGLVLLSSTSVPHIRIRVLICVYHKLPITAVMEKNLGLSNLKSPHLRILNVKNLQILKQKETN